MTDDIREKAIEAAARQLHGYIAPQLAQEVARDAIDAYERAMWRPEGEAPIGIMVMCLDPLGNYGVGIKLDQDWIGFDTSRSDPLHFRPLPSPPEDEA